MGSSIVLVARRIEAGLLVIGWGMDANVNMYSALRVGEYYATKSASWAL